MGWTEALVVRPRCNKPVVDITHKKVYIGEMLHAQPDGPHNVPKSAGEALLVKGRGNFG